jgi:hypothetical protein
MQNTYAMAELRWPIELEKGYQQGRLCSPAHFESDAESDWSLYAWLDAPMTPGEAVTIPVMPLISEAAERLLKPGAEFRLFLRPDIYALGRVISVKQVSAEDLRCVFHFC